MGLLARSYICVSNAGGAVETDSRDLAGATMTKRAVRRAVGTGQETSEKSAAVPVGV